ncbi:hypothetical protein AAC57_000319 [Salmonella enterica subsp. enterica]|nr:hypothetical protein [Salmonella enterica subsp. enterica]EDV5682142.1 hypothetical protein [Salmonella enterica subsp. enterica]
MSQPDSFGNVNASASKGRRRKVVAVDLSCVRTSGLWRRCFCVPVFSEVCTGKGRFSHTDNVRRFFQAGSVKGARRH